MTLRLFAGALLCVLFAPNADARPKHHPHHIVGANKMVGCSDPICEFFSTGHAAHRKGHRRTPSHALRRVMAEGAGRVVAHPRGCPRRAFCGCGAAVRIFGKPIRSLWRAANWLRFPRAKPAPGTVAVVRGGHHVFVLKHHIRGSTWMVYDANSGRHRTRVHPRSIAGAVIVDPRAGS